MRENRFCRGALTVDGRPVGPSDAAVPTLVVINSTDEVAPLSSVKPFLDQLPSAQTRVIQYPGEVGVVLQHLGILIGREAHAQVWPEIISWIDSAAERPDQPAPAQDCEVGA